MGFEPTTPGLKVRSSTAELRAPISISIYRASEAAATAALCPALALSHGCR